MTDLPARLRASVPKMTGAASAQCNDVEAVLKAADEIERRGRALLALYNEAFASNEIRNDSRAMREARSILDEDYGVVRTHEQ